MPTSPLITDCWTVFFAMKINLRAMWVLPKNASLINLTQFTEKSKKTKKLRQV